MRWSAESATGKSSRKFGPKQAPARRPPIPGPVDTIRSSAEQEDQPQSSQPTGNANSASPVIPSIPAPDIPDFVQVHASGGRSATEAPNEPQGIPWSPPPPATGLVPTKRRHEDQGYVPAYRTEPSLPKIVDRSSTSKRPGSSANSSNAETFHNPAADQADHQENIKAVEQTFFEAPNNEQTVLRRSKRTDLRNQAATDGGKQTNDWAGDASSSTNSLGDSIPSTSNTKILPSTLQKQRPNASQSKERHMNQGLAFPHQRGEDITIVQNSERPASEGEIQSSGNARNQRQPARSGRNAGRQKRLQAVAAAIVDEAVKPSSNGNRKTKRRSRRKSTPDETRNLEVAPSETRIAELCLDKKAGKISSREQELREMDQAAIAEKKQTEAFQIDSQPNSQEVSTDEPVAAEMTEPLHARERQKELARNVPKTIIRDGQIMIDPDSLQIDRHANAKAARLGEELSPVEENDLSRRVTSGKWVKRDKSGGWNDELLDRFYQGLRMFGTDFEIISRMFPGKSRHAIKLKFCKEERLDGSRIRAALLGDRMPVMLEEYETMTGTKYRDPSEIQQLLEEDKRRLEEEQEFEKQAMEEAARERDAQAAAERAAAKIGSRNEGFDATKHKSDNRKGKRRKKGRQGDEETAPNPGSNEKRRSTSRNRSAVRSNLS